MFDLQNESQGHEVQRSQWFHSMANINLYKSHTWAFCASSHRIPDIKYIIPNNFVTLKIQAMVPMLSLRNGVTMANINFYKSRT